MNPLLYWTYRAAGELASLAARVVPAGEGKLTRALHARRDVAERFTAWASMGRDRSRPLLWMHAPSVGEGLQARPLLERMRARRPEVQLVYTFFSPSAEPFARGLSVDFADYLPFDTPAAARHALEALRPTALVYSKLDVWPVLTAEARRCGVRLGLVSGTVAPGSSRRGGAARWLLRDAYAALDAVGAVSADDADRLAALGARADVVHVIGDTRYDQVAARAAAVDRSSPLLAPFAGNLGGSHERSHEGSHERSHEGSHEGSHGESRPTLVAGSTWPADEAVLLPAWEAVRRQMPHARLIIAPHEPTAEHLAPIEAWGRASGMRIARLGSDAAGGAEVVVVDRVGVLGDLYALASVAFVGGGFHAAGLHSVLEPAAFGAPVLFGPRFTNARDAELLVTCGGGAVVQDAATAAGQLVRWFGDDAERVAAGMKAKALVSQGLGAADRSFALVEALLNPPTSATPPGAQR
ncbi:MAG: hypothetical protein IPF98_05675 [Gemmatimonadetes bacterium]|nr:hypothetical protein [Gemmatimonadota bacterium]